MFSMLRHSQLVLLVLVFALAGCAEELTVEPPAFNTSANDNDSMDY